MHLNSQEIHFCDLGLKVTWPLKQVAIESNLCKGKINRNINDMNYDDVAFSFSECKSTLTKTDLSFMVELEPPVTRSLREFTHSGR